MILFIQSGVEVVHREALSWNVYTGYSFFIVGGAMGGKEFTDSLEPVCLIDFDLNE